MLDLLLPVPGSRVVTISSVAHRGASIHFDDLQWERSYSRFASICSFWYVEALVGAGRLDEARPAFEKMLTYANHLGLYAEEISRTGERQGNFPQAFTHLALISAAFNLDKALANHR